jgi:putative ABC transport system permease protein
MRPAGIRGLARDAARVARLAWREGRGAGRHFAYLVACVALGVAALVAVASLGAGVERTVTRSARALMGADVEVRSTRALSAGSEAALGALAREGIARTSVVELAAMARAGERTQLVELKAVGAGYPFYGAPVTDPAGPLPSLIGGGRALVHESLLERLGLAVGDRVRVGEAELPISGRILQEPDRGTGVFQLGPRVLIATDDLPGTGLVQRGSRVRHRALLRLPDGADAKAVRDRVARELTDPGLRVTTSREAQPGLRRFWDQLTTYLGLTGLVALLVGGIGVGTSVGAFVRGKLATIAVLKCLGAPWPRVLAVYLVQTAALGLAGSLVGALVGSAVQPAVAPLLGPLLPLPLETAPSAPAVLRGIAMGLGVTLLAALWPLLAIRRVPPAFILRREVEPPRPALRERLVLAGSSSARSAPGCCSSGARRGSPWPARAGRRGAARAPAAGGAGSGDSRGGRVWRISVDPAARPASSSSPSASR